MFYKIFYQPLLNILGFLVLLTPGHNLGLAIIGLTVLVNLILLPLTHKMKHSQRKMQEIQPHIEKIKVQYKDQKEEQARRIMEMYKEHGINPFFGFLVLFIQLPLFFAIFKILKIQGDIYGSDVYSFLPHLPIPEHIFLGINLAGPSIVLAVCAALAQFIQISFMLKTSAQPAKKDDTSISSAMQKNMRFMLPGFVFIAGLKLPAALALYWTTMSLFGIVHEGIVYRRAQLPKESYGRTNPTN